MLYAQAYIEEENCAKNVSSGLKFSDGDTKISEICYHEVFDTF